MLLTQLAETATTAASRVETAGGCFTARRTSKARLKATRWPSPWASTSAPSHSMMMPSGPPTPLPSAAAARKSAARWRAAAAALLPPTALQLLRWAGAAHATRWPAAAGAMADAGRPTERAGNTPTAACIVAVTRGSVARHKSRSKLQEARSPPPWRGQPPSRLRQLDSPNAGVAAAMGVICGTLRTPLLARVSSAGHPSLPRAAPGERGPRCPLAGTGLDD